MFIVDAQVHIWGVNTPDRPWPTYPGSARPIPPHLPEPLTAESLLRDMDALGIDRVLLVPPSWEGYRNDFVLAAAKRYPDRFRAIHCFHPTKPRRDNRNLVPHRGEFARNIQGER